MIALKNCLSAYFFYMLMDVDVYADDYKAQLTIALFSAITMSIAIPSLSYLRHPRYLSLMGNMTVLALLAGIQGFTNGSNAPHWGSYTNWQWALGAILFVSLATFWIEVFTTPPSERKRGST